VTGSQVLRRKKDTAGPLPGRRAAGSWSWPLISYSRGLECVQMFLHTSVFFRGVLFSHMTNFRFISKFFSLILI
jgi:hypothetical protein